MYYSREYEPKNRDGLDIPVHKHIRWFWQYDKIEIY